MGGETPARRESVSSRQVKVLHVEVGGTYGGSLRALEIFLAHSDPNCFVHDVLFYYPTPGMEKLQGRARRSITLFDELPANRNPGAVREATALRMWLKRSILGRELAALRDWISLFLSVKSIRRMTKLFRDGGYDVIDVNNTFTYQDATLIAAQRAGIPLVVHMKNPVARSRFNEMLLRRTDLVVTICQTLEKELRSWGLTIPICTCYDGVELPAADPVAAAAWRTSLLCHGQTLVGSVGRLDPQKGYHDLIRAARHVIDLHPQVRFVIAGEGPLRASLEALIVDLGLKNHFYLCGFKGDVANFLAALDLFVCSSHWEGLPLALTEAMLLGKPVIATDVGGNSELVIAERTGKLVPSRDPDALGRAIVEMLERKCATDDWIQEGIRLARSLTDPAFFARRFDEVLFNVARGDVHSGLG